MGATTLMTAAKLRSKGTKAMNIKTRKTILVAAIAALAVAYAFLLAASGRSPVKTHKLKDKIDLLSISTGEESVSLSLEGGLWYVGDEKAAADDNKVMELADAISQIKTLGTVSRSSAQSELERYGLADVATITVTAGSNGKTVRTVVIGKDASSSSTSYIRLDGSSETLLATGNLRSTFSVKADDLKMKVQEKQEAQESSAQQEDASGITEN